MKRFFMKMLVSVLSVFSARIAASAITMDGAMPDFQSLIQMLTNPTFASLTVSGAITPTGGIVAPGVAPLRVANFPMGSVALASIGTNTTDIAGQLWITELFVPVTKAITKIGFLQGGTATTDNTLVAIYNSAGVLVGNSATAGVVLSGANTFQEQALLTAVTLAGPATYYVAVQGNGTAAGALQTLGALYNNVRTAVLAGTFGTVPATITVPTTFTAAQAPVVYVF